MDNYFWFTILVAANSLLLFMLAMNVSLVRMKYKISLGDGGNKKLMASIRAHCNGMEQVPIYCLVILALTLLNASSMLLSILVIGFTVARLLHAIGMLYQVFIARRLGAGLSYLFQLSAVIAIGMQWGL